VAALARLQSRTSDVDAQVFLSWSQIQAPPGLALFAVGGYGRRELFPYSDIDLLVLTENAEPTEEQRDFIGPFLQSLWDKNLRISQSVRDIGNCCKIHPDNLELTISLLDRRMLIGDNALGAKLQAQFPLFLNKNKEQVLQHLIERVRQRHVKFDGTIQHLEPDVKDGPGGLRDANVMRWLSALGRSTAPPDRAVSTIAAFRHALHEHAKRDQNVLRFEVQYELFEEPSEPMRGYYRAAAEIYKLVLRQLELNERKPKGLLGQWQDWQARLSNSDFTVSRHRVLLRNPTQLDYGMIQRLVLFVAKHGIPAAADTQQRLEEWRGPVATLTWDFWRDFLEFPHAGLALRALDSTGLLTRILAAWGHVDYLVVPDFYHRYTVDEHTLRTIETFDRLLDKGSKLDSRFVDLAKEVMDPELLRLSLLLHDLGKGTGNDHSEEGVKIARDFFAETKMPEQARLTVEFLVDKHLLISELMAKRDLTDEEALRPAAEAISTAERLRLLAVFTYCDISAVNPQAMTPWRADQLWRAYRGLFRMIARNVDEQRLPAASGFAAGFPLRYQQTHTAEEMAEDERLEKQALIDGVASAVGTASSGFRVSVATKDRHGLFADLAGAIAAFGLNIVRAEAFSGANGLVVDRFFVEDPFRALELNPSEIGRLEKFVRDAAIGRLDVQRLLAKRKGTIWPGLEKFEPSVVVDQTTQHTIVEVEALDRPGLLHDLARALADLGCDLDVTLIDTQSHRALDVFYVTKEGRILSEDEAKNLRSTLLALLT
jgi:[protein-PII] uridylyltransferase